MLKANNETPHFSAERMPFGKEIVIFYNHKKYPIKIRISAKIISEIDIIFF